MDRKRKIILSASIIAIAAGAGQLVQSNIGGADRTAAASAPTGVVMLSAKAGSEADTPVKTPAFAAATPAVPQPVRAPEAARVAVPAPQPSATAASAGPAPGPAAKALAELPAAPKVAVPAAPVVSAATTALPAASGPAVPAVPAPQAAAVGPAPQPPATAPATPAPVATADTCAASLSATALPGAVLSLALVSPCDGGARVVLRHGGLAVTGRLSDAGTLFTTIPAMEPKGEVSAMFPDGSTATAAAATDLAGVRRLAVQWQADDAFQLQVYENGAAFGMPGHVSAERPVGAGKVDVLGDASVDLPMLAQVYTWPLAATPVEVTIEAAVTDATCNREILGEAVEMDGGRVTATDITLAMPDCGGIGDFLVLNNLAGGTTLAAAE